MTEVFQQQLMQGLLIYLILTPFFFYMRMHSLAYFVASFKVTADELCEFLGRPLLRFSPMRKFVSMEGCQDFVDSATAQMGNRGRVGTVLFVVFGYVFYIIPLLNGIAARNTNLVFPSLFWIFILTATFIYSWRFGHDVKQDSGQV